MKYMNNRYGSSGIFGNTRCKLPMNLQFFAEPDGNGGGVGGGAGDTGGAAGGEGDEHGAAGTGEGGEGTQSTQSFDDFLKNPANQSEFDRRVAKALETQRGKMQTELQTQIENARTEAEKLAKMNAEQKAQYEREKKDKELTKREAALTARELKATAKETLANRGLPTSLADVLNYENAEACNKSIEAVEAAFREAVAAGVDEKLKGGRPPKKAPDGTATYTKEQIAAMTPEEINKNWDAVQASMRNMS